MAYVDTVRNGDFFFFENTISAEKAAGLSRDYNAAEPFPHIVLDEFFPEEFIDAILDHFPPREHSSVKRNHEHTQEKWGYRPDDLGNNLCRHYLSLFNSGPMLRFLESLTGIDGLLPDPHFLGGGLHEIGPGGKLDVHTDFNLHKPLRLVRRINFLLYLNADWQPEYGGELELWDRELSRCVKSVVPIRNRCVIFNTDQTSYHGHPRPLTCPEHESRRSVAIYYYTSPLEALTPTAELSNRTTFPELSGES